jgi:hypothetical protein
MDRTNNLNKMVDLISEIENRLLVMELKITALLEKEKKYVKCDICNKKYLDIYGELYDLGMVNIAKDVYLDPYGFYFFCRKCAKDFIVENGRDCFKKNFGCDGPN